MQLWLFLTDLLCIFFFYEFLQGNYIKAVLEFNAILFVCNAFSLFFQALVAIKSLLWIPSLIFKQNTLFQIKGVITVQN